MKYEAKLKKEGSLSHATRTLVESSARLSQESIGNNMSIILASIDLLLIICGNYNGEEMPDTLVDDLLAEKDSQAFVVAEAMDSLGDRTEKLKIEPEKEKRVESSGGVSPGVEQRYTGWTT